MTAINNPKFALNNKQVTLATTKLERSFINTIINITIPKTDKAGTPEPTKLINLRRIENRFTVDGHLVTGVGVRTGADIERNAAPDKEADLIEMFRAGEVINMTWIDGSAHNIVMEKMNSERLVADGYELGDGEAEYVIKMTCLEGDDLI